jgi:hypothetical protein
MSETTYVFTKDQLYSLLRGTVLMYVEYVERHDKAPYESRGLAALEMLDGLDAERELYEHGELRENQLTQVIAQPALHACVCCARPVQHPNSVCDNCRADYEQSGVENL